MSLSEVERFASDAKTNPVLMAEVAKDDRMETVVRAGARHGYSFTLEDLKAFVKAKAAEKGRKLSDAQLDQVAAGVANCAGLKQACSRHR